MKSEVIEAMKEFEGMDSITLLNELCDWAKDSARLQSAEERAEAYTNMCAIRNILKKRLKGGEEA